MKLTIPQLITRKTSLSLNLDEDLIHEVISFQFTSFKEALHNNESLELTNMGVFTLRKKNVIRRLNYSFKILRGLKFKLGKTENRKTQFIISSKITSLQEDIELLKSKLEHEDWKHIEWMEEQSNSPKEAEGDNSEGTKG